MLVVDSALTTWKISSLRDLGLIAYLLKIRLECCFSLKWAVVQIPFLQQMSFTDTFMTLFPPGLRYVNSNLFARRISACLHSALHLTMSSIRAGSSLQRVPVQRYFKESCWIIQRVGSVSAPFYGLSAGFIVRAVTLHLGVVNNAIHFYWTLSRFTVTAWMYNGSSVPWQV